MNACKSNYTMTFHVAMLIKFLVITRSSTGSGDLNFGEGQLGSVRIRF